MTKKVILYSEDSTQLRNSVKRFMEDSLPNVIEDFSNGNDLISRLKNNCEDVVLVLTDNDMPPGISGLELISTYSSKFPDIPFILLSGDDYAVDQAVKCGARDSLDKMHISSKLIDLIKKYIRE